MDCPESRATLKLSEGRHWIGSDFPGDVFPSCPEVGLGAITTAPVNVPTAGQKRVVVVGASGMVGGYTLRCALDSPAVKSVTSIGRKKLGISEPKLKEVVHQDFSNCSSLADLLSEQVRRYIVWGRTPFGLRRGTSHHNRRLHD